MVSRRCSGEDTSIGNREKPAQAHHEETRDMIKAAACSNCFCILHSSLCEAQLQSPWPQSTLLLLLHMTSLFLPLCLLCFPPLRDSLQYVLPILIDLQFRDHDFARRNAQWYALSVALFARDSLDVDDIFQTVDGCHLPFTTFVGTAGYNDFVVFANGNSADLG